MNIAQMIGVGEAARILGLSETMVRKLADKGDLVCFKTANLGRLFNPKDVEALRVKRERG